jgi:hypothetical protein
MLLEIKNELKSVQSAEGGIVRDPRQAATCEVAEFGKSEIGDTS